MVKRRRKTLIVCPPCHDTIHPANLLLFGGAFELGQAELDSLTLPSTTASTAGLVGVITANHTLAARLNGRPGDAVAPMAAAVVTRPPAGRGRHDDAVLALRTAEDLFPTSVRRNPMVRDVLGELLMRARRDAVGRELGGMAYRAGLPV